MTPQEFQSKNSLWLAEILRDQKGQAFLQALGSMITAYESPKEPHLYSDNRGQRRGYESCLRNIISLSFPPRDPQDVQANYGVSEKPTKETK